MKLKRTSMCGILKLADAGGKFTLAGWVHSTRDLGALVFVDLRDRTGVCQLVANEENAPELHAMAKSLRSEDVVAVSGTLSARDKDAVNRELPTGEVELVIEKLEVLNRAKTPPFELTERTLAQEDLRLKYRYLDLRRPALQKNIIARHNIAFAVRQYFHEKGFLEIETPFLFRSTPEGARDYVVPSRIRKGSFYALPQSPQILKQLLIIAGFDRYFQIVRCFRDEDLRAHRQPEFTQIDVEMAFPSSEDVWEATEGMMERALAVAGKSFKRPLVRIAWRDAMERYGSDAPDTRFSMEIVDFTEEAKESAFSAFRSVIEKGGVIKGVVVKGKSQFSRKHLETLEAFAKEQGADGLLWLKVEEELKCPVAKHLGENVMRKIVAKGEAERGDIVLFLAGEWRSATEILGRLRLKIAREENFIPKNENKLLWVTDFPAFDYDPTEKRYVSQHHPFTAPMDEDLHLLEKDPSAVRAKAYDLVWNGIEMGGGSIRNNNTEIQMRIFKTLGFSEEEAKEKFSFLLEALSFGAPPHGGIALGFDRIVMLCLDEENIRNVIAFPKTGNAMCLMSGAPSPIDKAQLRELGIKTD